MNIPQLEPDIRNVQDKVPDNPNSLIRRIVDAQRDRFLEIGPPDLSVRKDRLERATRLLVSHQDEFVSAGLKDFGAKSELMTQLTEFSSALTALREARKSVAKWMKPRRRSAGFPMKFAGARARIQYQPLGVVGVISPWNLPISLSFAPIAGAFAAGNSILLKPSEYTPYTSELIKSLVERYFDPTEAAVFTGGTDVSIAFANQNFDHLFFTGSTTVGRQVMRAASENLVPVTLELGGKSPVILGKRCNISDAMKHVIAGKTTNGGQLCLAPDYLLVPKDNLLETVSVARDAVNESFPTILNNPDYTSIINENHFNRLQGLISDAKSKGAEIIELHPPKEEFTSQQFYKIPPTLVLNPNDEMLIMQEEIFGPLLPIVPYDGIDEAINYVNNRARPLALYYFGRDKIEQNNVLDRTVSGGVTINDVIIHYVAEDLPFGGVGESGFGSYHGFDGFETFSHRKSILTAPPIDTLAMMRPPYGKDIRWFMRWQIGK